MINYIVSLSLGANSNIESGVAVQDINTKKIIYLDKLFSMQDVTNFFNNFSSLQNSIIFISLPWDNTMLEGKWRVLSKSYQLINSNDNFLNKDNWMQRFSPRGVDLINSLKEKNVQVYRYEIYLTRQKLNLYSNYKERSTADCKFLQTILKNEFGFSELPTNMMPVAQLEAIVGLLLAEEHLNNNSEVIFDYKNCQVVNKK